MHVLIAPGKFQASVKASALAEAMARGLKKAIAQVELTLLPFPNGGAGSMDILVRAMGGRIRRELVAGPFGRPIEARWAMLPGQIAWIDAAEVVGIALRTPHRDATRATTRPLGELYHKILRYQPQICYITLGDTIVNDGGMGLLQTFHIDFFDSDGQPVPSGTSGLERLARINFDRFIPPAVPLVGLYSFPYPVAGDSGTTFQFGQEKGLPLFRLPLVDEAMRRYGSMLEEHVATSLTNWPGVGAGGATGLGLAFLGAQLLPAVSVAGDLLQLEQKIASSDWVLTLEDQADRIAVHRVAAEVARRANVSDTPVVVLTSALGSGYEVLYDLNVWGIYPWLDRPRTPKEAGRSTSALVEQASFRVGLWMSHFASDHLTR